MFAASAQAPMFDLSATITLYLSYLSQLALPIVLPLAYQQSSLTEHSSLTLGWLCDRGLSELSSGEDPRGRMGKSQRSIEKH